MQESEFADIYGVEILVVVPEPCVKKQTQRAPIDSSSSSLENLPPAQE
jgi:hypothetical protein